MRDYYSILKIPKTASIAEIKKAYKSLSEKWNSKNNLDDCLIANKMYKEITHAYKILSDEHSKELYDNNIKSGSCNKMIPKQQCRFGESSHISEAKNRCADDRVSLRNNNARVTSPSDIFKTFSSEFRDMFKFSEDMLRVSESMFKMPIMKVSDPKNPNVKIKKYFKEISSETTIINGKRKTIAKINENGKETVMVYEDDVLKSKTIDGVPQTIKKIG